MSLLPVKPEIKHIGLAVVLVSTFFPLAEAVEGKWDIEPSIRVASTYSDNIGRSTDGDSDLVMEIEPGVRITRDSNRAQLSVNYSLQNLTYVDDTSRNETNHRLAAILNTEVVPETFFVDMTSSVRQELIDRSAGASGDSISGSENLSNVYSYSISPYWQEQFGNIAEWELGYTFDTVSSSRGNDSDRNAVYLDLVNGDATGRLSWNINYDDQQINYADGRKSETESTLARLNYRLTRAWSAVVSGYTEDNEFIGGRGNSQPDDSYVGAGATWDPSQDFSLTLLYNERLDPRPDEDGNFISGDLYWAPTARTDLNVSYGNSFFGETYNGTLRHSTRRTRWNLSYDESVSDFRSLFLEDGLVVCPTGAAVIADCRLLAQGEVPQPNEFPLGTLSDVNVSITDDTFINKRARASVSMVGAHNTVTLGLTNSKRQFVADNNEEQDIAVDLSWLHEIGPKTDSRVTLTHINQKFEDSTEDDIMRYSWRITRQVASNSIAYVEAQYYDRDSDVSTRTYDESRLTVSFQKFF